MKNLYAPIVVDPEIFEEGVQTDLARSLTMESMSCRMGIDGFLKKSELNDKEKLEELKKRVRLNNVDEDNE